MTEPGASTLYPDAHLRQVKVRKEITMTSSFVSAYKGRAWISVAGVVLLVVVALLLPQIAWADHGPDYTNTPVRTLSSGSSAASYQSGLVSSGLLAAYPEILAFRHDVMAFLMYSPRQGCSAAMNPGLTDPALLAAYPEIMTYRRNVAAYLDYVVGLDCQALAARLEPVSSRPSALMNPGLTDPTLLAAYPEVLAYRHDVMAFLDYAARPSAREACSETLGPGLTDPTLLAAYPEILTYRRNVLAYQQYFAQQAC